MKNSISIMLVSALIIGLSSFSCGTPQQKKQVSDDPFVEFMQFYRHFLEDSAFQMERVLFPLEGIPSSVDSTTLAAGKFRWQKEDWELHRPFNFEGSDFEQQFIPFNDDLIIENIVHKSGNYASERRFAKIEGQWYLIYYAGLNQVN
jgi:hypothetical protein